MDQTPSEKNYLDFAEAIRRGADPNYNPLPMEPEIWAAGADLETAHFVARILRDRGFYLIRPDDIEWEDIHRFQDTLRGGQGVREDAGGFWVRALKALLRIKTDPVQTYRDAARDLLVSVEP